ncbi:VOC family protein [Terrabacter carboxydivorans]|uniref:VOC family protein n=1 Tax=Terrabacter carboxydivorans TaxID=619730 RepID=A0ABN3LKV0_9MICO
MTSRLLELCHDARDPDRLAHFWGRLLRQETDSDGVTLLPRKDTDIAIRFVRTLEPRSTPNQMHLHLTSSSAEEQQSTVNRALELGGRHLDVGQTPEEGHVVLADPEGNEFCVIEPGNSFLADTAFLGELACDGTRDVGIFWSAALGWPLVWDHDEETAIQSPRGGAKIAWGGPPVRPRSHRSVMHFHVGPPAPDALDAEVERLLSLGARRLDRSLGAGCGIALADPDGNEFCVQGPRPGRRRLRR